TCRPGATACSYTVIPSAPTKFAGALYTTPPSTVTTRDRMRVSSPSASRRIWSLLSYRVEVSPSTRARNATSSLSKRSRSGGGSPGRPGISSGGGVRGDGRSWGSPAVTSGGSPNSGSGARPPGAVASPLSIHSSPLSASARGASSPRAAGRGSFFALAVFALAAFVGGAFPLAGAATTGEVTARARRSATTRVPSTMTPADYSKDERRGTGRLGRRPRSSVLEGKEDPQAAEHGDVVHDPLDAEALPLHLTDLVAHVEPEREPLGQVELHAEADRARQAAFSRLHGH